jgi:signal transduction histidine kinase
MNRTGISRTPIFNSLFWKLSATFLLILLVLGTLYLYVFTVSARLYFQETSQRLNASIAAQIVKEVSPFINGQVNKAALEKIFHDVMVINPSLEVYLLDATGNIITYSAPQSKIKVSHIPLAPLHEFIQRTEHTKLIRSVDPRNPGIWKAFSAAAVEENNVTTGYIYIILASEEYESAAHFMERSYMLRSGMIALIIASIAALLIGLLLIWIITKNLQALIIIVKQFQQGDMQARISITSKDEISQLAIAFNDMAETIGNHIENIEKVEKSKRELIANVSHDLRTPLAIMHGYVETMLIKSPTLDADDRKKYLQIILQGTENLKKLVNELFELSKLEAYQIEINQEPFFINELIQDIMQKYQLIAGEKGIYLQLSEEKKLPPVYADVSLMERVLQNLLDNAIKFTSSGGEIIIELEQKDNFVEIKVSDTGIGIPIEEQPYIFDRYWKMNREPMSRQESSGLGLSIVKRILEIHRSTIIVESNVNMGSTFSFKIPVYGHK